jgi:hypothetical protein
MITTVTVWPQDAGNKNPSDSQIVIMNQQAGIITPDYISDIQIYMNDDNTVMTSVRSWPTAEAAQAWSDYLTSNYSVTSSEVHVETVDTSTFGSLFDTPTGISIV